jgi:L-iditol 2-dehydrogenase
MRALLYDDWESLTLADLPEPKAGPGEVVLQVAAVGICGSELEAFRHRSPRRVPPLVLGHEFCGVVQEVGPGAGLNVGDRVVSNSVIPCENCPTCRRGLQHACPNRHLFGMQRPGAMAERVAVPARVTLPWDSRLSAAQAAMAEPLGNGMHVANLARPVRPEKVVVLGAGPIGLMCLQAMRVELGCEVAVMEPREGRRGLARKLGAALALEPAETDALREWTGGEGVDVAVDAMGARETKDASIAALRNGGLAVWIGLHANVDEFSAYNLVLTEKAVTGSYATTQAELAEGLRHVAEGRIDVSSWVTPFGLEAGVEAFGRMLRPADEDVKAVLLPPKDL